jgi:hypothetical protein
MTNNKQQSAVDLIYQRMSDKIVMQDVNKGLICIHISHDDFIKLAKQAKEMEKEQSEKYADYVLELFKKDTNPMSFSLWNETYRGDN